MPIQNGDEVTFDYVARRNDATVFDTSREAVGREAGLDRDRYEPLTATVGTGELIEGVDRALVGMEPGGTATVTVSPGEGYGEYDEGLVTTYEMGTFLAMTEGSQPEVGSYVTVGEGRRGEIAAVEDGIVEVDFNHRLAGETLEFEIEVRDVG